MRQKTSKLLDPKIVNEQLLRNNDNPKAETPSAPSSLMVQHPSESIRARVSSLPKTTTNSKDFKTSNPIETCLVPAQKKNLTLSQQPTLRKIPKSLNEEGKLTFGKHKRSLNSYRPINNNNGNGIQQQLNSDTIDLLQDKKQSTIIGISPPHKYPSTFQTTMPELQNMAGVSQHRSLVPVLQSTNRQNLIVNKETKSSKIPPVQIDQHQSFLKHQQAPSTDISLTAAVIAKNAQNLTLFTTALGRRLNNIYGNTQTLTQQYQVAPPSQQILAHSKMPLPSMQYHQAQFAAASTSSPQPILAGHLLASSQRATVNQTPVERNSSLERNQNGCFPDQFQQQHQQSSSTTKKISLGSHKSQFKVGEGDNINLIRQQKNGD